MTELDREIEKLATQRGRPSVTLYMPLAPGGFGVQENQTRFKDLVTRAGQLLQTAEDRQVSDELLDLLDEEPIWRGDAAGLAVFHSPSNTNLLRLPRAPEALAVVEDRFHLKPLLAMVAEPRHFFVLAMSQNANRLIEVNGASHRRIEHAQIPASLEATLPADRKEAQLQYHSNRSERAIYHGHGEGEHRAEHDLRRYLAAVDEGLVAAIPSDGAAVVLAGVDEITAEFRRVSKYPRLAATTVSGNVESESDSTLAERAHDAVLPELRKASASALERARELLHTERTVSSMEGIVQAAIDGRVDTLFLQRGARRWGSYDAGSRTVQLDQGQSEQNEDLLDLAALKTHLQGGMLVFVEAGDMPIEGAALALLRY